jgi:hypothetical protein
VRTYKCFDHILQDCRKTIIDDAAILRRMRIGEIVPGAVEMNFGSKRSAGGLAQDVTSASGTPTGMLAQAVRRHREENAEDANDQLAKDQAHIGEFARCLGYTSPPSAVDELRAGKRRLSQSICYDDESSDDEEDNAVSTKRMARGGIWTSANHSDDNLGLSEWRAI